MLSNNDHKYLQDKRSKIQSYVQYAIFYVIRKEKIKINTIVFA